MSHEGTNLFCFPKQLSDEIEKKTYLYALHMEIRAPTDKVLHSKGVRALPRHSGAREVSSTPARPLLHTHFNFERTSPLCTLALPTEASERTSLSAVGRRCGLRKGRQNKISYLSVSIFG
ncbi:hypothetical protein EVAR_5884_1 [Eumeta japonica]|uniref:Uncharacterized protein n=1 Tax=Eumeta variegata TaxID=151549 RepID=A0A4C1TC01_EUMVA|nr:hypothetical protein EVAR_5884_1 [Eumeta japonica]